MPIQTETYTTWSLAATLALQTRISQRDLLSINYIPKEVKIKNGIAYRCKYKERDSRLDFYHSHRWEKTGDEETKIPDQTKVISDYNLMLRKIIILAGHFNLSFSVIESVG